MSRGWWIGVEGVRGRFQTAAGNAEHARYPAIYVLIDDSSARGGRGMQMIDRVAGGVTFPRVCATCFTVKTCDVLVECAMETKPGEYR